MQSAKSKSQANHAGVDKSAHETRRTDITAADEKRGSSSTSIHPYVFTIALGAVVWFLAATWFDFAWDRHVDLDLSVVTGFVIFFFGLLLIAYSIIAKDSRWGAQEISFADFLQSRIATYTGMWRGRDVLIGITLIPVALALGATLIGLTWLAVRLWQ
jgi:hypothetical protein